MWSAHILSQHVKNRSRYFSTQHDSRQHVFDTLPLADLETAVYRWQHDGVLPIVSEATVCFKCQQKLIGRGTVVSFVLRSLEGHHVEGLFMLLHTLFVLSLASYHKPDHASVS